MRDGTGSCGQNSGGESENGRTVPDIQNWAHVMESTGTLARRRLKSRYESPGLCVYVSLCPRFFFLALSLSLSLSPPTVSLCLSLTH